VNNLINWGWTSSHLLLGRGTVADSNAGVQHKEEDSRGSQRTRRMPWIEPEFIELWMRWYKMVNTYKGDFLSHLSRNDFTFIGWRLRVDWCVHERGRGWNSFVLVAASLCSWRGIGLLQTEGGLGVMELTLISLRTVIITILQMQGGPHNEIFIKTHDYVITQLIHLVFFLSDSSDQCQNHDCGRCGRPEVWLQMWIWRWPAEQH